MGETKDATVTTPEQTTEKSERTFTQSELNAILEDRLKREKSKYANYEELKAKASKFDEAEEANKTELQKATERAEALQAQIDSLNKANAVRDMRAKVAQKLNVPESLLTGDDEESCIQQATSILEFAKKTSYPAMQDGGESGSPAVTKQDILSIKNDKERLKAIKDHIDLFQ